ncbi:hypothetical protein [Archangium violaceum]|uniref:Lipoprotein n=1 Tax=Archangium violaceum Cb vi76 TaxID=1406225 RepID=A0A084SLH6_9BACT|nr:hypothetical protein [Archangium violaceum]KFA89311.1 hypothetical protein Q664_35605 [Archangium violaceum Cb vi76]
MRNRWMLLAGLALVMGACGHVPGVERSAPAHGVGAECNTAAARIQALIAQGRLVEAEALIAESTAAGLISRPHASQLLTRIAQLNTKLGEIPARLQRAKDFPSQLKNHTLYQIEKMMEDGDFSLATKAQLQEAAKLIKEQPRLMDKL